MKQNEADKLANNLIAKFGLPLKAMASSDHNGQFVTLHPTGVHANDTFQIRINIGWRSLIIELLFGKFARDFLEQMSLSSQAQKIIFNNIATEIIKDKGSLNMKVNGVLIDPLNFINWPEKWKSFEFELKKSPLEINTENHNHSDYLINIWVERFFACVIALSPIEEAGLGEDESIGLPEGAVVRVPVNRYERSRYNRSVCINFHGVDCKVCNFNFHRIYGRIGDGFIHVHHIIPVSRLGSDYFINPIKDLIPVCPNCHYMLHKKDPPMSIDELKAIINAES